MQDFVVCTSHANIGTSLQHPDSGRRRTGKHRIASDPGQTVQTLNFNFKRYVQFRGTPTPSELEAKSSLRSLQNTFRFGPISHHAKINERP